MTKQLTRRVRREDEGFTLIELMVVVLIIAILLAIAIPTFLGARSRAENRAAQSNLRNALTAEKTVYSDNPQAYSASTTTMRGIEPSLSWVTSAPAAGNIVEVQAATNEVCLTALSASGVTYYLVDVAQAGTGTTVGTFYGASDLSTPSTAPTCDGNTALAGFFNNSTQGWA